MNNSFKYVEPEKYGNSYRTEYFNGVNKLILKKQKEATEKRNLFGSKILSDQEAYRNKFKDMLGWPLNEEPSPYLDVKTEFIADEDDCEIYRVQIEVFEDFWFYGILFKRKSDKPLPLVIAQHGGLGTPEMIAGFFNNGNYNNIVKRILNKNVHVFAPQLLLWQENRFGPATQRQWADISLKQLGGSVTALEVYCISRCIDYLENKDYTNGSFGMIGLSYGGFYTYHTAAVDTRIKSVFSCSQFNDRYCYNWQDWAFKDAANTFFDAEIGALIYPRPLCIEVGDKDNIFDVLFAKTEFERLKKFYTDAPDKLRFNIFKGVHEFSPENDDGIDFVIKNL